MNSPAARQLEARGGDSGGFTARRVSRAMVDVSDLVLCATSEQVEYVVGLRPEAAGRTFVLGEFGRLLADVDLSILPPAGDDVDAARDRGIALVVAVDALRGGGAVWGSDGERRRPARRTDDLTDPWGMADQAFAQVADTIERTVVPLAAALTG
jgi:protein-tyrosine phosphatase